MIEYIGNIQGWRPAAMQILRETKCNGCDDERMKYEYNQWQYDVYTKGTINDEDGKMMNHMVKRACRRLWWLKDCNSNMKMMNDKGMNIWAMHN
jgi:hypothetical protein